MSDNLLQRAVRSQTIGFTAISFHRMNVKQPTVLTNLQRGNVKQENPLLFHQRTLHELAAQGELYSVGSRDIESQDANGLTPLQWAAGSGQNLTVDLLLELGANVNHRSDEGRTALMFASSKGFLHVVKALIQHGADVNHVDSIGNSALIYAAHQDRGVVVQELLRNGADLGTSNVNGQTAYSVSLINRNKASQAAIEAHLMNLFSGD